MANEWVDQWACMKAATMVVLTDALRVVHEVA
jgi:hypothetical protein